MRFRTTHCTLFNDKLIIFLFFVRNHLNTKGSHLIQCTQSVDFTPFSVLITTLSRTSLHSVTNQIDFFYPLDQKTTKIMSNTSIQCKFNLFSQFVNTQMSDFLTQIASEYKIDSDELTEKWANFTGLPKKTVKTSDEPTVKDLRAKLRSHGLKVSGKKEELIDRLDKFDRGVLPDTVTLTGYEAMTVKQLKEKLRERGLTVGGKKAELIEKLHDSDNSSGDESEDEEQNEYKSMTVKKLTEEMNNRGIKKSKGDKKADLIDKLIEWDNEDHSDSEDEDSDSDSECSDCETDDEDDENTQRGLFSELD